MMLKTTTRYIDDNEYESTNASGNTLQMDMYPREEKKHHSPMELLLDAAAGCAMVDVVQILKKRKKNIDHFEVIAEGERKEDNPKKFLSIHLQFHLSSPDIKQEEFEKACKLVVEKYCSVASTLMDGVPIKDSYHLSKS